MNQQITRRLSVHSPYQRLIARWILPAFDSPSGREAFGSENACQIHDLLCAWCRSLGIAPHAEQHHGMIETMECVTTGVCAAGVRRHRFQPIADDVRFLHALAEDCAMKTESSRRVGIQ